MKMQSGGGDLVARAITCFPSRNTQFTLIPQRSILRDAPFANVGWHRESAVHKFDSLEYCEALTYLMLRDKT
jgi:hypothetical protein